VALARPAGVEDAGVRVAEELDEGRARALQLALQVKSAPVLNGPL
jgi:hypothetical protein